MKKYTLQLMKWFLVIIVGVSLFTPVWVQAEEANDEIVNLTYEDLLGLADGTTVTFYGWGGDEQLNKWLDDVFAPTMLEKYNITMERVPMDIEQILNQLSSEKQANLAEGDIDMIWINGENFKTAKENDFLFGPFLEMMPNFKDYVDAENPEHLYDFGYPIEGFEAPYGRAQLVFIKDSAVAEETPKNAEELLEFVKKHPGQVTYPALPDFTGSAFVRNIIYEFVDYQVFQDMEADKEVVREAIQPALKYLRELNPYLWNEGLSFPATSPEVDNMFMDGELVLRQSYGSFDAAIGIAEGRYPETVETFVFDNGTIGNTNFMAIAKNSANKAGAIVAINEMLSPEMQLSRYEEMLIIPVIDNSKLTEEQAQAFDQVDIGQGTLSQEFLLDHRLPEMPAGIVPLIEEIWLEEVVGQ